MKNRNGRNVTIAEINQLEQEGKLLLFDIHDPESMKQFHRANRKDIAILKSEENKTQK
jgi:hypothetical protein